MQTHCTLSIHFALQRKTDHHSLLALPSHEFEPFVLFHKSCCRQTTRSRCLAGSRQGRGCGCMQLAEVPVYQGIPHLQNQLLRPLLCFAPCCRCHSSCCKPTRTPRCSTCNPLGKARCCNSPSGTARQRNGFSWSHRRRGDHDETSSDHQHSCESIRPSLAILSTCSR